MNLYIYYDVAAADAALIAGMVRTMQTTLGLPPPDVQLLRRADTAGDRQTWMEIYTNVSDDFEARLAATVDARGLANRTGARHIERFVAID